MGLGNAQKALKVAKSSSLLSRCLLSMMIPYCLLCGVVLFLPWSFSERSHFDHRNKRYLFSC